MRLPWSCKPVIIWAFQYFSLSSLLMSTVLIRSATSESSSYWIVLTRLGGLRFRSNPQWLKIILLRISCTPTQLESTCPIDNYCISLRPIFPLTDAKKPKEDHNQLSACDHVRIPKTRGERQWISKGAQVWSAHLYSSYCSILWKLTNAKIPIFSDASLACRY